LWLFASEPTPARIVRSILAALIPSDLRRKDGTRVVAGTGGLEIFPKQDEHKGKKVTGNMVWAPWWREAPAGANQFYAVEYDDSGNLRLGDIIVPEFQTVNSDMLSRLQAEAAKHKTENQIRSDKPEPTKAASADNSQNTATQKQTTTGAATFSHDEELLRVRSALESLDPDCEYETWLRIGMAIHSLDSGPSGFELFDSWSRRGSKYEEGCTQDKWQSFTPDAGVNIGTLFHHAKEAGWTPPIPATRQTPQTAASAAQSSSSTTQSSHPEIIVNNRQDREIVNDAWAIILKQNERAMQEAALGELPDGEPQQQAQSASPMFLRGGHLTRLTWFTNPVGESNLVLETLDEHQSLSLLTRLADWVKISDTGILHVRPPKTVIQIVHSDPVHSGGASLPQIEAVAHTPILDAEGRLIATPGYHPHARLWLSPSKDLLHMPEIAANPSAADIASARSLILDDLFVDFPFAGEAERANAVAALLLPFVRRIIAAPTPLHLIESPTPGTGKTLLADVISLVATGRKADPISIGRDEAEIEKKAVAILLRGRPIVLFDNINHALDSGVLAAVITSYPVYNGRRLSVSEMLDLPNNVAWLATANNPRMTTEIARRCARIRLDAPVERPWERTCFKHSPLVPWIIQNRARIIHACLTLIRSWQAAGSVRSKRHLGSFDEWSETMGGILEHVGIAGFIENLQEMYDTVDDQTSELRELIAAWWDTRGEYQVTSAELNLLCEEKNLMFVKRGDGSPKSQQTKLGIFMKSIRDRIVDGKKVHMGKDAHTKTMKYWLSEIPQEEKDVSNNDTQASLFDIRNFK